MKHLGDFDTSTVVYGKFSTYRPSTGAAFTLAGTPALSVYKDNSTTQSTTGVTLTVDFDAVTGLHHFAIDTSADGTFYSAGSFFDIVITTGTVDSISVVGTVVASFTIRKNSALKPATAGRTLAIDSSGIADANTAKYLGTAVPAANTAGVPIVDTRQIARQGTAQAGAAGSIILDSGASATDAVYIPCGVRIISGTGAGQSRIGLTYTGSTKVLTVAPNWTTNPSTDSVFQLFEGATSVEAWLRSAPSALSSGKVQAAADLVTWLGTAPLALTSQMVQASVAAMQSGTVTSTAIATDAITSTGLAASAASEIATAVGALVAETQGSRTVLECLRLILALCGGVTSGGTFKTADGVSTRASVTYTGNDRTAVTLTP